MESLGKRHWGWGGGMRGWDRGKRELVGSGNFWMEC